MAKMRLLLGDDHTLLRQKLRKILKERPGWQIIAETGDGREAMRRAITLQPDVAVLDIGLPLLNGLEAAREIRRRAPNVRVLMLSTHPDEAYVVQALQAGAKGYLLKDSADTELIRAVSAVAGGKLFFSPTVAGVLVGDFLRYLAHTALSDHYDFLCTREREIFQLVAQGYSDKEIADLLSLRPDTVEVHRARLLEDLRQFGSEVWNSTRILLAE